MTNLFVFVFLERDIRAGADIVLQLLHARP